MCILSYIMSYKSHVRRHSVGGSGGRSPPEKQAVCGAARRPNQGDGRGRGGKVNGFWGMMPSRGMIKVGLMCRVGHFFLDLVLEHDNIRFLAILKRNIDGFGVRKTLHVCMDTDSLCGNVNTCGCLRRRALLSRQMQENM